MNAKCIYLIGACFLLLVFPTKSEAQLLKRFEKRLKDKVNKKADEVLQRAEQKVEDKVDETINRTEERIEGNGNNNRTRRTGNGGVLARVGPPRSTYSFTHFVKMRTKMTGRRARNNMTTTARLDYGISPNVISISEMTIDGGRNNEMQEMDRMILDVDQSAMYTFMRIENRKTRMGMKFNMVDAAEEIQKPGSRYKTIRVAKTGQTKTVAGYKADAYLCKADDNETIIWISRANGLNPYPDFYNAMNSSRLGSNNGMALFHNSEVIKRRMMAGAMVLAYEWNDQRNGDKVVMEIISFGKARTSFSTVGYSSLSGF